MVSHLPPCTPKAGGWRVANAWLTMLLLSLLFLSPVSLGHQSPVGCTGSGLGIDLFANFGDVHIGDTIRYSVRVFNSPFPACDATGIQAAVITPDGITNSITALLRRAALAPGESDFYTNVVTYVVRAQDIRPDGSVRATAFNTGDIHQNDTNSRGGGNQGVNTEVNQPCIAISAICQSGVGENGALLFTGIVTNCGNTTLVGVTVTNFVNNGAFTVLFPTNLAIGQSVAFSGSWIPADPCVPSIAVLAVRATDEFTATPRVVQTSATVVCQNVLTPSMVLRTFCPVTAPSPGQVFTYSGSISNSGNVTLSDIVVLGNTPGVGAPVFTLASLAPGSVAVFTGGFNAPTNCSVAYELSAAARSVCGTPVTSRAGATCPITTNPGITIIADCPSTAPALGGVLIHNGTVRNSGDVTLTNVVVVSDRPVANTVVFTALSMAPGQSATFTSAFNVPDDVCFVATRFGGSAQDLCKLSTVSSSITTTCSVLTSPRILVTLDCPVVPPLAGGSITYTGRVENRGNVTLTSVVVLNSMAQPSAVLRLDDLAPGEVRPFTTTFTAPANICSLTATVTAQGQDACSSTLATNSASATCPLITQPGIAVFQDCPQLPASPGGQFVFGGLVRNTGNVSLTNVAVYSSRRAAPTNGLAGYWPLDELAGDVAADSSTNGNSGRVTGAVHVPGLLAGALVFGGGTSTIEITNSPSLNFTGPITLSAWIKPASVAGLQDIIAHGHTTNAPSGGVFLRINEGRYEVGSWDGTSTPVASAPIPAGDIGNFVGLAGVYDGSSWTLYRGGVALDTVTTPVGAVLVDGPWAIGSRGGGRERFFDGIIDEVRIYNRALTPGEVALLGDPTGLVPVFSIASLAPGESAPFTGSIQIPSDAGCSLVSVLHAGGFDLCSGVPVNAGVTNNCPLTTSPAIVVVHDCPVSQVLQGGLLAYSGTVRNNGDTTLTNIQVISDRPAANTVIFTVDMLSPGASRSFSGSYLVPANCCVVSSTLRASGGDCTGRTVSDTHTSVCAVQTRPQIVVTKTCPETPFEPGGLLKYSGSVSNAGDVVLIDVMVINSQPGSGSRLLGPVTLAPGESAPFSAILNVPLDFCGVDTVTATGLNVCSLLPVTHSVTTTCPVITRPRIVVTRDCPKLPVLRGGSQTITGSVGNTGNVTLVDVFVTDQHGTNSVLLAGPLTLTPGATFSFTNTYTVPGCCCFDLGTVYVRGLDACSRVPVTASATSICSLQSAPGLVLIQDCPVLPLRPGAVHSVNGIVMNSGDVLLTNVVVSVPAAAGLVFLGPLDLAPGESQSYAGSFIVPLDQCNVVTTVTGADSCSGRPATYSINCPVQLVSSFSLQLDCPAGRVPAGSEVSLSGILSNNGEVTLTNLYVFSSQPAGNTPAFGPITLAPGSSIPFSRTYVPLSGADMATNSVKTTNNIGVVTTIIAVSFVPTNSLLAVAMDACQGQTIASAADCFGPLPVPVFLPVSVVPDLDLDGSVSLSVQTSYGASHSLQFKNSLNEEEWQELQALTGTGGLVAIKDPAARNRAARFYRITTRR